MYEDTTKAILIVLCPLIFFASAISMAVYFRTKQSPHDMAAAEASLDESYNNEMPMTLPKAVEEKSLLVRRLSASAEDDELRRVSICVGRVSTSSEKERDGDKLEMLNSPTVPPAIASKSVRGSYGSHAPVQRLSVQTFPAPPAPQTQDNSDQQISPRTQLPRQEVRQQNAAPDPPVKPRSDRANSLPAKSPSNPNSNNSFRANKRISYLADEVAKKSDAQI